MLIGQRRSSVFADPFVKLFRNEVKLHYRRKYCVIKLKPWESGNVQLETYFTGLSLRREDKADRRKGDSLTVSHDEIFTIPHNDSNKIVLHGASGTGKTTLCKKLAYDWALETPQSPLKHVPVLCIIESKYVQSSENLIEAIHRQLIQKQSQITIEKLTEFIHDGENASHIVLIIDGHDELPGSYEGDINDLISGKYLQNVKTLITTRTSHVSKLLYDGLPTQLMLNEFSTVSIEKFVNKYFVNEQVKDVPGANRCLRRIRGDPFMAQLARIPIFLSMICFVLRSSLDNSDKMDTLDALFEAFLRVLFEKYADKNRSKLEEDYEMLKTFWEELGAIAFESILASGIENTELRQDKLKQNMPVVDIAKRIGLLNEVIIKEPKNTAFQDLQVDYEFPHLLFQHKCAADYVANHIETIHDLFQKIDVYSVCNFNYLFALASGKSERAAEIIIECLNNKIKLHNEKNRGSQSDCENSNLKRNCDCPLFRLCLFIYYESQGKEKLAKQISTAISGLDCIYQAGQLFISGDTEYEHLAYFLRNAYKSNIKNVKIPDVLILENVHISIEMKSFIHVVSKTFKKVTYLGLKRCPRCTISSDSIKCSSSINTLHMDLTLPGKDIIVSPEKQTSSEENASDISLPIFLEFLTNCCPLISSFSIKATNLDIPVFTPKRNISGVLNLSELSIRTSTEINFDSLFSLLQVYMPNIRSCEITNYSFRSIFTQFFKCFVDPTSLESRIKRKKPFVKIKGMNSIPLQELLVIIAINCKHMDSCSIAFRNLEVLKQDGKARNIATNLAQLVLRSRQSLSLPVVLSVLTRYCPILEDCKLRGRYFNISADIVTQQPISARLDKIDTMILMSDDDSLEYGTVCETLKDWCPRISTVICNDKSISVPCNFSGNPSELTVTEIVCCPCFPRCFCFPGGFCFPRDFCFVCFRCLDAPSRTDSEIDFPLSPRRQMSYAAIE